MEENKDNVEEVLEETEEETLNEVEDAAEAEDDASETENEVPLKHKDKKKLKKEEIPITVATVDMDWHWVNIKDKFGKDSHKVEMHKNFMEYVYDVWSTGWTGYSFNTDLFPDPQGFLKKLKDDNYHVTFNLHPSQGVRWYEDCYEEMCEKMGQDPSTKEPVQFDITDEKFVEHYFKVLHHPMEKMGVDWWGDWDIGDGAIALTVVKKIQ